MNGSGISYIKQLDGFRFFAVTAVMIAHFIPIDIVNRFPFGYGVLFFFVLSSFLITRILVEAKQKNEVIGVNHLFSLRQFYIRRFLRIFPIYYLLIIFLYIINWDPCRNIILSLVTYTTNFKMGSGYNVGSFTHLWSLAVEEQFYIFFPFFVFFINTRHLAKVLISFIIIGLLGRILLYLQNPVYIPYSNFHTISCLDSLGIGGLLAYLTVYKPYELKKVLSNKLFFTLSILSFLLLMIFSFTLKSEASKANFTSMIFMRFTFNVMSFWILGWAVVFSYKGIIKKILENRILVYLGRISYGLYVYHLFVPTGLQIILGHFRINIFSGESSWPLLFRVIIYYLTSVAIASVSWYIIEKPINNFKKYFSYNKRPGPVVSQL